jgi:hypothetical protein
METSLFLTFDHVDEVQADLITMKDPSVWLRQANDKMAKHIIERLLWRVSIPIWQSRGRHAHKLFNEKAFDPQTSLVKNVKQYLSTLVQQEDILILYARGMDVNVLI